MVKNKIQLQLDMKQLVIQKKKLVKQLKNC